MESPATSRVCPQCGGNTTTARVPRLGVLPELNIFRCLACDEVVTMVESSPSLVQVPAELGFIRSVAWSTPALGFSNHSAGDHVDHMCSITRTASHGVSLTRGFEPMIDHQARPGAPID